MCVIFTPKQVRYWPISILQSASLFNNQSEAFAGLVLQVCAMFTSCQVAIFAMLVSSSKTTKKI